MDVPFWKMHGAGNDFILVDDRALAFPCGNSDWIASIAARRTGVGSDGVILIQPSERADFRMRFFNPDGSEVEMCGNGARCVARLAHDIGAAPAAMRIDTVAGILAAEALGEEVRLTMTDPAAWRLDAVLATPEGPIEYGFVNTGVPHAVVLVEDLDRCDVAGRGRLIREHADFAPAGTNANFVQVVDGRTLRVRTYERGVEAETLACGTGIVAAALVCARQGKAAPPVRVRSAGGYTLAVDFKTGAGSVRDVTLLGPAAYVFSGTLSAPDGA